jgi:DNA-binding SARP family transcriptional activator/class 3 adenylate cyclase
MEFGILGPLEVVEGDPMALPRGKPRALLALLLLRANDVVSQSRLVEELWDRPPESAPKMVHMAVSQLRKSLPELPLETASPGYRLAVSDRALDLARFVRLADVGRTELEQGDAGRAAATLARALQLWRGPALEEFDEPFARRESLRLEELRLAAVEDRIDADLAIGRHGMVAPELEALVREHPLRERLRAAQMLALFRSGRHAEALAAFQEYRRTLDEELGLEPSAALRDLERAILTQDPSLDLGVPGERDLEAPCGPGDIRYARSGDTSIAFQTIGDGPLDLVLVHGWVCTFHPAWESPRMARFYRRLARMGRLILFDKRGTGLSDRVSLDQVADLETRMDDVRAVMDGAGSERAVVLGISEGGSLATLFAATYPERTVALVLMGTFARALWAPDYEIGYPGPPDTRRPERHAPVGDDWATRVTREWLSGAAPAVLDDEDAFRWYVSYVARGASPGAAYALEVMNAEIDIRHILGAVRIPTLLLHREHESNAATTRYMAERMPGARLVALPGRDHLPWEGDADALLDQIEAFLASSPQPQPSERVLATVLFTDIVDSTGRAAAVGDAAWRELRERHDAVVRAQLATFRGVEVETAGDGFLATFDGPARAVRCAAAIARDVARLGIDVRAGVHTGEVETGERGVHGIAVNIGARIAGAAQPGEVLVSSTVKDLVGGSGLSFEDRGTHALKGVPEPWRLFAFTA